MIEHDSDKIAEIHERLHSHLPPEPALRLKALESLMAEKGMVDCAAIDAWVEAYCERIGPRSGARVVARAWLDADFKQRLLEDGGSAVAELGYQQAHLAVVENTADVHNLVVCTLCSCYPTWLLGMPPNWYKMAAYRSRAVREPRSVLEEFGVRLDRDISVRVWDSNSEIRYMVMPRRPDGTEDWDEERLAAVVTRNAMIGTQRLLSPGPDAGAPC